MWEPLQKQFLTLSLKTSAALLYAGEGRLFILRSLSIFKKENVLKSFDFRTFGGDKRDRTADLLNAIYSPDMLVGRFHYRIDTLLPIDFTGKKGH